MQPGNPEQFYIQYSTPKGLEVLEENAQLQQALQIFIDADEAHKARIPGMRLLGAGRYSFTFALGGIAMKISTPTSSQKAFDEKKPLRPENLTHQFKLLRALGEHLQDNPENITVPEQLFVAHTPLNAFILAQELKQGWITLTKRTIEVYGPHEEASEATKQEVQYYVSGMRERLENVLSDFVLIRYINDLGLHHPEGVHGENLLVPKDAQFNADIPLCIIDQPCDV